MVIMVQSAPRPYLLQPRANAARVARAFLRLAIAVPMVIYILLSELVSPLVRPVAAFVAGLELMARLRRWIAGLSLLSSLLLLAVPVLILEPLKLYAVYRAATGHPGGGTALLIVSHGLSLLLTERVFAVVRPKLLTMPWFAKVWEWLTAIREGVLRWLRSTWPWRFAAQLASTISARARIFARRIRAALRTGSSPS